MPSCGSIVVLRPRPRALETEIRRRCQDSRPSLSSSLSTSASPSAAPRTTPALNYLRSGKGRRPADHRCPERQAAATRRPADLARPVRLPDGLAPRPQAARAGPAAARHRPRSLPPSARHPARAPLPPCEVIARWLDAEAAPTTTPATTPAPTSSNLRHRKPAPPAPTLLRRTPGHSPAAPPKRQPGLRPIGT